MLVWTVGKIKSNSRPPSISLILEVVYNLLLSMYADLRNSDVTVCDCHPGFLIRTRSFPDTLRFYLFRLGFLYIQYVRTACTCVDVVAVLLLVLLLLWWWWRRRRRRCCSNPRNLPPPPKKKKKKSNNRTEGLIELIGNFLSASKR